MGNEPGDKKGCMPCRGEMQAACGNPPGRRWVNKPPEFTALVPVLRSGGSQKAREPASILPFVTGETDFMAASLVFRVTIQGTSTSSSSKTVLPFSPGHSFLLK